MYGSDLLLDSMGLQYFSLYMPTDSYVTVPSTSEPTVEELSEGFTISAWVQPSPLCDGYIVARSSADGTSHYYSLRLTASATATNLTMTIAADSTGVSNVFTCSC